MQTEFDKDLLSYFTDVVHLRDAFSASVAAPTLTKRLLIIHGVGGVGKSSLLRMFRLHCKSVHVPIALASGDDAKSVMEVLAHWADDLKADGVTLGAFAKTLEQYHAIQGKVDAQAKKAVSGHTTGIAGKAASKTAEAASSVLAGAAIGSIIPGIGTAMGGALGGVLGGMGAEALVDWLRGFLPKPDIDLLLDPTKVLTDDFLADVAKVACKRRIVLMLDTFEWMSALEGWVRGVAQQLHPNVLFVIAGRALPNWNRTWDSWQMNAQIEELEPMTEEVMRDLVRRYYATMRGGEPDPVQVDAIIRFARGLPMVVTSAVQLWVNYDFEDFQSVKAEIVANLVDRLMEGVPKELVPALEAAAIVRRFDQPILRAVMGLMDVREIYNELRRFPFVRGRDERLALHDAVREIMDENLRAQDSERHCELHERAAAYFEKRLEKVTGEEAERIGLERLYHRVCANEGEGIRLFQEVAEELTQYRLINRLRVLLNDADVYPLERENSRLWREYYWARLADIDGALGEAERTYQVLSHSLNAELKLRAYSICDYGAILERAGSEEKAVQILEQIPSLDIQLDSKLIYYLVALSDSYRKFGRWNDSISAMEKAEALFKGAGNLYGQAYTIYRRKFHYLDWGWWKQGLQMHRKGIEILSMLSENSSLKAFLLGDLAIAWTWMGSYAEGERNVRDAIAIAEKIGLTEQLVYYFRDLALLLTLQGKVEDTERLASESITLAKKISSPRSVAFGLAFRAMVAIGHGELDKADENFKVSIDEYRAWGNKWVLPLILVWRGVFCEAQEKHNLAEEDYQECLALKEVRRLYHQCAALTGIVRVKQKQGHYAAIPSLLAEAEQLAQQYEYNDHLASLRLTQGHMAWEGNAPNWENGLTATVRYYQHALIYALRFNRFLLDEVLSGRPQGTPLRPIIPYCLEHGEEGHKMLVELRDWWQTGINDIGAPRPDTVSPIPEGIPLIEAERIAREHEPGDGSLQKSVVERIEAVLSSERAS